MQKPLLAGITAVAVGTTTLLAIAAPAAAATTTRQVIYVADPGDGYLAVLDASTYEPITYVGVGGSPTGVTLSPDGSRAYIGGNGVDTVAVLDTATSTVTANIQVGPGPMSIAVSPDGARVYVTSSSKLSVIDAGTNAVVATVGVGSAPYDVAVSPDGRRAYVADNSSASVKVVDTTTNTVTASVPVPGQPHHVAVTPDGRRVYVVNSASAGSVSAIDTATNTVTATIPTNDSPHDIAITPDGGRVYVPTSPGTVQVISTATNTVTATIPGFDYPYSVAVTPDGSRAIVTNADRNVVAIDTATNTVQATGGDLGFNPAGLAIATVHPAPPTASLVLTTQPESNRVFWDTSGSKHGFDVDFSRSIDWGDGGAGTDGPNFHDYAHGGTYTVTLTATDLFGQKATTSKQITLQPVTNWFAMLSASNLRYVSAESAGAQPLVANRTTPGAWENLVQVDVGGGAVVFRADVNGKYLTVDPAGRITANGAAIADASRFKVIKGGNGLFNLLSLANNRYVSSNNGSGPLTADRAAVGPWEQFYATRSTGRQFVSLTNHKYVTAENGGNSPLIANRDTPGLWETFDEIDAGDGYIALFSHANQRFVTDNSGIAPLIANRTVIGSWEKFYLEYGYNSNVTLRAEANNCYVTAENGGKSALVTTRPMPGAWEQFVGL